ncbi:MAG TPA: hypothetical protein DEP01_08565 [Aminobacterium sp.]|jgi:response regulator of citrate/malate metabolism|uniref:response regulator n=1 Tax=Aminobacterium TaxID=81466 RepID=UPI000ED4B8BC|nr:response regulator [Aminobacterium sp. UBA4834]HCA41509.1 hypothetical protein [Aminobacterium sp.]
MKEEPIHILIADQDLMTVSVMERYISAVPGFVVVGIASTLPQLCLLLQKKKIDVIFVEPAGLASDMAETVGRIHRISPMAAIIVVSSLPDRVSIQHALSLGAFDYILKPFSFERFRQSLYDSRDRQLFFQTLPPLCTQKDIDDLFPLRGEKNLYNHLPISIQQETLDHMIEVLSTVNVPLTIGDIAFATGFSRTTTWRYLDYLLKIGSVVSTLEYRPTGRPLKKFKYLK